MKKDLIGGYCPKCDTVWAASGICNCYIPYHNTKEGMHEAAKLKNLKAWSLGCSCDECNKEFGDMLNELQDKQYILKSTGQDLGKLKSSHDANTLLCFIIDGKEKCYIEDQIEIKYIHASHVKMETNVYADKIWNAAIEAAAILLRDTNRNGTDDVALVRKLKK